MSAQDETNNNDDGDGGTVEVDAAELAQLREKAEAADRSATELAKRFEAIEKRAKNRPPDASDIKALMADALGVRSDAIDEKQGARDVSDAAEALAGKLASVESQLRRRDIVDAAKEAGAHNPNTVADIVAGRDGEPGEVVAALRESEKWMFKAGSDPDAGQGRRYESKDPGMRELEQIITESRR